MKYSRDNSAPWIAVLGAAALLSTMVVACPGCGGWASNAAHSLEATAALMNGVDRGVAESAKALCGSHAGDHDALAACLHDRHIDGARVGIHTGDAALRSAQAELDAANAAHDQRRWQAAAPCLAAGIRDALAAVEAAGVHVPSQVDRVISFLGLAGQCQEAP